MIIEGDRNDDYDYNDYDMYAYDEEQTEKMKKEHQLRLELQSILSQLNSTQTTLPTAVSEIQVAK